MVHLINQNRFEELKEQLNAKGTAFAIHGFLLDVLNHQQVEIGGESFDANRFQEEFMEGLAIYEALEKSAMDEAQLQAYTSILVELAFKMGAFIQLMAKTAMDKGVYLSDMETLYQVKPGLRDALQKFHDLLAQGKGQDKAMANVAAAKAKVSNSIGNLLGKHEIGEDMLQFAAGYEKVGQVEMATNIYRGTMNDFDNASATLSSGLFPEVAQADTRTTVEIAIFEAARTNYERLTGEQVVVPRSMSAHHDAVVEQLVESVNKESDNLASQQKMGTGLLARIKRLFRRK